MKTKYRFLYFLLLILLLQLPLSQTSLLLTQEQQSQENIEQYLQTISDGPYFFRQNGNLQMNYIHQGKLLSKEIKAKGGKYQVKVKPLKQKFTIPVIPPLKDPSEFKGVKKIFVVSDVHGQLQWFKALLLNNKIVNKKMNWRWKKGHLVVLGDIFDRGEYVTEILWMVYRLEQQAQKKGGKVHFTLGNHEAMPLYGDLRYVHKKYTLSAKHILKTTLPELYGPKSILGEWLRTKNTIIRINNLLLVHAGIHPEIIKADLNFHVVNDIIRTNLGKTKETLKADEILGFMFFTNGPLWFRGYFSGYDDYQKLEPEVIQQTLDHFSVDHILVGHSTQEKITKLYDGKVIGVDSGIKTGKRGQALLWEKGKFYVAKIKGKPVLLK
jgi:hypothetical protein